MLLYVRIIIVTWDYLYFLIVLSRTKYSLSLSLSAAELPTPKSHYLQTNTIPVYEDDLFNQLVEANNDFATPCE